LTSCQQTLDNGLQKWFAGVFTYHRKLLSRSVLHKLLAEIHFW
jgi:hypothetical protein